MIIHFPNRNNLIAYLLSVLKSLIDRVLSEFPSDSEEVLLENEDEVIGRGRFNFRVILIGIEDALLHYEMCDCFSRKRDFSFEERGIP